ncbi:MAG: GIY-YIG nuclease family protein [Pseudomonadota bacterium]|nr:GIY-YIG nuclease family protein [Pseudomonadota bacterium]
MNDFEYYVYIMAKARNGTLYIGMSSDLPKRVWEHKTKAVKSFTSTYDVQRLVYYDGPTDLYSARVREAQLKCWRRAWKIALIEEYNPEWEDLYDEICI